MENRRKVIVAGAGAAGLMAAIAAARQGAEVTVLEAMERPGKKLLLTGNGRCNMTNMDEKLSEVYYGSGRETAHNLTRSFDAKSVCSFFEELGLLTQEKNGYVYPYSAQSTAVLDVLLAEVRRLKIKLKLSEKILSIKMNMVSDLNEISADGTAYPWTVETATWSYHCDSVILACGSKCVPSTGSDGTGYELAGALGHKIVPVMPALVPVTCQYEDLSSLSGVRCRARVSLYSSANKNKPLASEAGELQWTRYGVSGIVVFQLSRFVSNAGIGEKQFLSIDLLPEYEEKYLFRFIQNRSVQIKNEKAAALLAGMLNEKLIPVILKEADRLLEKQKSGGSLNCNGKSISAAEKQKKKKFRSLAKFTCSELEEQHLSAVIRVMKHLILPVTGTRSFDSCQVCSGGVDCREVNADTMESMLHKGLYFAGEIMDVDGPCGGYNLQWAWSSGYTAGVSAASKVSS